MRQTLPWHQNQAKTAQTEETDQYLSFTQMQKASTKYWQIEPRNIWKELYTMTKLGLFQGPKAGSVLEDQCKLP